MAQEQNRNGVMARLARHSAIYGIGSALAAAGGFLLIPLYTQLMSASEYGVLELLNRVADILLLVMFMGLRQAYIRFYFEDRDPAWQRTVTATTVVFVLISALSLGLLFYAIHEPVLGMFLEELEDGDRLVTLVLMWIPMEMLINVGLAYLQVRVRSVLFVVVNLLRLLAFIGLNVYLLYFRGWGVAGVLMAQVIVTSCIGGSFLLYFIYQTRLQVSWRLVRRLVGFGLPYLPATAFMYVMNNGDRYFIGAYESVAAVGVYALAHKIGMMGTQFIMDPFNKVWSPFLFEHYDRDDGPHLISRVFTLYTLINVFAALAISVAAPVVIPWISDPAFYGGAYLVPLLALASVFYGMSCLADAGILIAKKTRYKPLIFGVGAAVSVAGNVLLVPWLGIAGAGIAFAAAFFSLLVVTVLISSRFYRIPLPLGQLISIFLTAGVLYGIGLYGIERLGSWWLPDLSMAAAVSLLFPVLMWWGGIVQPEEKAMLARGIARMLGRPATAEQRDDGGYAERREA